METKTDGRCGCFSKCPDNCPCECHIELNTPVCSCGKPSIDGDLCAECRSRQPDMLKQLKKQASGLFPRASTPAEPAAQTMSERELAIEILKNCAAKYVDPLAYAPNGDPQQLINDSIDSAVRIIKGWQAALASAMQKVRAEPAGGATGQLPGRNPLRLSGQRIGETEEKRLSAPCNKCGFPFNSENHMKKCGSGMDDD